MRIPAQILDRLNLAENSHVNLEVKGDRLIIEKVNPLLNLDQILNSIPEDFEYPEDISDFTNSFSVGKEAI